MYPPKTVIPGSNCTPSSRSVYPTRIPTFKCVCVCVTTVSPFVVRGAQFPSPSLPCGSSPDTKKQMDGDEIIPSFHGFDAPHRSPDVPECVSRVCPKNTRCCANGGFTTGLSRYHCLPYRLDNCFCIAGWTLRGRTVRCARAVQKVGCSPPPGVREVQKIERTSLNGCCSGRGYSPWQASDV